jgi:hypothetical protein
MDFSNVVCPACRKLVREPINLICDHNLCFKCAERLLVLDSERYHECDYLVSTKENSGWLVQVANVLLSPMILGT